MASFIVWDMSRKADGVWRIVDAADARKAAEQACGKSLKTAGTEDDICARVRSLDDESELAVTFYGSKTGEALREQKMRENARNDSQDSTYLEAAE